ncbi:MAG: neutral/alkaline non-lysosomal ceramidase N-terminal domain-containing protein [Candidatus Poribacteria bacterium]
MGNLKIGTAKVNITPPLGCQMAGYSARDRGSETISDALYSKALVFDDGQTQAAIITNDLIGLQSSFVDRVRLMIEDAIGIPGNHVMISCSHTHFGPEVRATRLHPPVNVYPDFLAQQLTTVTQLAQQRLQSARVGVNTGTADNVSYNRHTIRPDGKAITSFRRPGPDSDLTFGPYDPTLQVLRVDDAEGNFIASLIHFACHPVTTTDRMYTISADYPGYAMAVVEKQEGGLCLFGLGCAGNIVPIQREGKFPRMIGRTIGGEAIKVLQWTETTDDVELKIAHQKLSLELRNAVNGETTEEVELQCIAIGSMYFIGLPGEIFVEIGFDIVNRAHPDNLFVMSMTNGSIGYIPIEIAYEQGGYESGASRFRPGCGEQVADAAVELLNEME